MYKSQFKKQPKSISAFPCQAGDSFHIKSSLSWLWTNDVKLAWKMLVTKSTMSSIQRRSGCHQYCTIKYEQPLPLQYAAYCMLHTILVWFWKNVWKFSPVEIENGKFGHLPLYRLLSSLSVVVSFTTRCNDFRFWWQCTYVSLVESSVLFPITILIMKNDRYKSVLLREPGWQRLCPSGTHHLRLPNHKYN